MAIRSINRSLLEKCAESAAKSDEQLGINGENDISVARDAAMRMAQSSGFTLADSTSVATAVSELARNILHYASAGKIVLSRVSENGRRGMKIMAIDSGPGIANLDEILSGSYTSRTGMGLGLLGTKRLMDRFQVDSSSASGTRVTAVKYGR
jgi:serine/threonine-protein kinase RsbT